MRCVVLFARSSELATIIARAEELIASPSFSPRKDEARTRAGIVEVRGYGRVFIKRSASRSWISGFIERFKGSRASRAVKGSRMLEAGDILHPKILAAMEIRRYGSVHASFVISEALGNADTMSRFVLGPKGGRRHEVHRRKNISKAIAQSIRAMHEAGIYTRDLQETNLMIEELDGGFRVYFIDLEDFARARRVSLKRRLLNLVHLDRSIGRFVGRAGRLRFLYAYLGDDPERANLRPLVARLLRMRARLDRRAAARAGRETSASAKGSTVSSGWRSALGGP